MPSILFQETLPFDELATLSQEFPHYDMITECEEPDIWSRVEILYGSRLTEQQLEAAPRLRWIHSPSADTKNLCIKEIKRKENILITLSKGQNVPQIAEFVIGAMMAFAKQFFLWPQVPHEPTEFWDWPLKETMWTLKKKTLLQVGLGEVGTAIVKMANGLGMKTWGVRKQESFHPYCKKTFPSTNLHSLLPAADVVCVALPKMGRSETLFGLEEFTLMKRDSIFIVVGSGDSVDEEALAKVAQSGKFRGILVDAYRAPPKKNFPLWKIPNAILTPSVSSFPASEEHRAFRLFRQNLRVFAHGKINEMKNRME
ncbi:MAG: Glyoxylate/hydroxypyruvate reductase B [Chlamydiales bacterium]|nr:Glyoxylate/hydroxypyruvate reductase B [Chlamydiales bacterium]